MSAERVIALTGACAACVVAVAACTSGRDKPPIGGTTTTTVTTTTTAAGGGGTSNGGSGGVAGNPDGTGGDPEGGAGGFGGFGTAGASSGGGGAGGGSGPHHLGNVTVVDEPDVNCVHNNLAVPVEVYPAAASQVGFDRLATVGARRVASGSLAGGFVVMDPDGANASASVTGVADSYNYAASEGSTIGMAGVTAGEVLFRRYDANGAPVAAALTLGTTNAPGLAIGGTSGASLVLWGSGSGVSARGITSGGVANPVFSFGAGSIDGYLVGSVAPSGAEFAAVWSGRPTPATYRTSFVRATTSGTQGGIATVATSSVPHNVVKVVRTLSGFAVLFAGGVPTEAIYVLSLGTNGQALGPAHRLYGATEAWDLAANGDSLGVVAKSDEGDGVFRPLDALGEPTGPWVCFAGASPGDFYFMAGIDAEASGFSIVYRADDGSDMMVAVDAAGTGVP